MPLLKYNDDDGLPIEPVFYISTLPIILINGTTGIGTGWSSEVPQFNPIDIIANIRNLISDKPMNTMTPWYRGFTGSIKRLSTCRWLTKGRYEIINNTTIEITELPISVWTERFKAHLDILEAGNAKTEANPQDKKRKTTSTTTGKTTTKKPSADDDDGKLIKSYENHCSESKIRFIVKFESDILNKLQDGYDKNGVNNLEKALGLTSTISCENTMNLYDEHNRLKNFKSAEEILKYYYDHRIQYYEKRRLNLIKNLEADLFMLSTRAKFILDVINEVIKVRNVSKIEVVKQLEKNKYPKMISKVLTPLDKIPVDEVDDYNNGYDFLVSMPIYSLTKEKVEELLKEKDEKQKEVDTLKSKTDKDLWEEDLILIEKEYKKHMDEFYEYNDYNPKEFEGKHVKAINRTVTISKKVKKDDE
jgi:DNA topoisomerase-2